MKKVTGWFWMKVNLILGTLIGVLGCSCKRAVAEGEAVRPVMCMYGVPTATYHIQGKVTDSRRRPMEQVQVTIKRNNQVAMGEVTTDSKGRYQLDYEGFPTDTIRVVVQSENAPTDSVLVRTHEGKGSKGFNMGESSYNVDISL